MTVRDPVTLDEALERIRELEQQIESLDALLLLRGRVANDNGQRHRVADVATELGAEDLLQR